MSEVKAITVGTILELLRRKEVNKNTILGVAFNEDLENDYSVSPLVQFSNTNEKLNALALRPYMPLTLDYKTLMCEVARDYAEKVRELEEVKKSCKPAKRQPKPSKRG